VARHFAGAGRGLGWRNGRRLHLLRRPIAISDRPVILLVGGLLDSVELALLAIDEGRNVALTDHANGTSRNGT
jgi:hypothetical protein